MNGESQVRRAEIDESTITDTLVAIENRLKEGTPEHGVNQNLAGVDLDTVWQDYWWKYGEYLVWEGWVAKYPDQIDFEKLHPVPVIAEVEVQTEAEDNDKDQDIHHNITEVRDKQSTDVGMNETDPDTDFAKDELENETSSEIIVNEKKCRKDDNSLTSDCIENPCSCCDSTTDCNNKMVDHDTPSHQDYTGPCSPMQYLSPTFKCIKGEDIVSTLQKRTEISEDLENCDTQSDVDNVANERTEVVNMMHSYSSHSRQARNGENVGVDKIDGDINGIHNDIDGQENDKLTEDDFSKAWEELWNEHYTESYWNYYNQFAEKFNKIAPHDADIDDGTTVAEGIAIVNEKGELEIVQGLTPFDAQNSYIHHGLDVQRTESDRTIVMNGDVASKADVPCADENIVYVVDNGNTSDAEIFYVIENEDGSAVNNLDMESIASILNGVQLDGCPVETRQHIDELGEESGEVAITSDEDALEEATEIPTSNTGMCTDDRDGGLGEIHADIIDRNTYSGAVEERPGADNVRKICSEESEPVYDHVGEICVGDVEPVDGSRTKRKEKKRRNQQQTSQTTTSIGYNQAGGKGVTIIIIFRLNNVMFLFIKE